MKDLIKNLIQKCVRVIVIKYSARFHSKRQVYAINSNPLRQYIPENVFLGASQASGETDVCVDDQVAAVARFFGAHHS
jgi:hypothetical protein